SSGSRKTTPDGAVGSATRSCPSVPPLIRCPSFHAAPSTTVGSAASLYGETNLWSTSAIAPSSGWPRRYGETKFCVTSAIALSSVLPRRTRREPRPQPDPRRANADQAVTSGLIHDVQDVALEILRGGEVPARRRANERGFRQELLAKAEGHGVGNRQFPGGGDARRPEGLPGPPPHALCEGRTRPHRAER